MSLITADLTDWEDADVALVIMQNVMASAGSSDPSGNM